MLQSKSSEGDSSATPNPHVASIEDPSLVVEDFNVEEQVSLTSPESDVPPKLTLPAPVSAQTTLGSGRSIPILRNGKV